MDENQFLNAVDFRWDAPDGQIPLHQDIDGVYTIKGAQDHTFKKIGGVWHAAGGELGEEYVSMEGRENIINRLNKEIPNPVDHEKPKAPPKKYSSISSMNTFKDGLSPTKRARFNQWYNNLKKDAKRNIQSDRDWKGQFDLWLQDNDWHEEFYGDGDGDGGNTLAFDTDMQQALIDRGSAFYANDGTFIEIPRSNNAKQFNAAQAELYVNDSSILPVPSKDIMDTNRQWKGVEKFQEAYTDFPFVFEEGKGKASWGDWVKITGPSGKSEQFWFNDMFSDDKDEEQAKKIWEWMKMDLDQWLVNGQSIGKMN